MSDALNVAEIRQTMQELGFRPVKARPPTSRIFVVDGEPVKLPADTQHFVWAGQKPCGPDGTVVERGMLVVSVTDGGFVMADVPSKRDAGGPIPAFRFGFKTGPEAIATYQRKGALPLPAAILG